MPIRFPDYLASLRAYVPGRPIEEVQREFGLSDVVKMASNENPLGPSPLVIEAIAEWARFGHLYPDAGCVELKSRLSQHLKLPTQQIAIGNGSDELIHLLSLLLLTSGDSIVMAEPGFSRYEAEAIIAGATTKKVPLDPEARHDLNTMAEAIDDTTRIVWIANPNNPTGTIVRKPALDKFLEAVPDHVAVVLDEAYFEFATDSEYPNSTQYLSNRPNLIGLRTFSKSYGLAGLRVGYAVASHEVIQAIEKVRPPFSVNSIAQRAAMAAINDDLHLDKTIQANRDGVSRLTQFLATMNCTVSESFANFVWCDVGYDAGAIAQSLLSRGVIVRPGGVFGCPNHLRISVGTPEAMGRFEEAFAAILRASAAV